jgi:hypothetical protein
VGGRDAGCEEADRSYIPKVRLGEKEEKEGRLRWGLGRWSISEYTSRRMGEAPRPPTCVVKETSS